MNPIFFPVPLAFIFLSLLKIHPSFAFEFEDWFFNCTDQSACSNSGEYPVFGRNKGTEICGYPRPMRISCEGNHKTIEILGAKYELLGSTSDQILIIAELSSPDTFCSQNYTNIIPIYGVILLSGACKHSQISDKTTCHETNFGHIHVGDELPSESSCFLSAVVPIPLNLSRKLEGLRYVADHIRTVFDSEPKVEAEVCISCSAYGGVCGYDLPLNQTRCYCRLPHPDGFEICPPAPSPDKKGKFKKITSSLIGVSIGLASFFAIILGCCIFYCLQRKKKHAIEYERQEPYMTSMTLPNQEGSFLNHPQNTVSSSNSQLERGSSYYGVQVFSYAELEKATNGFNRSKELGDGGFGTVYYGKLQDGREVAVKRLYENNYKRVEQFMNEVDILAHLHHNNLVKLHGCTSRRSQLLLLVYEYIPNGTLADHLHGSRATNSTLTWPLRLRIAIETAHALAYLHRVDVIHRDVKTSNILLDNNFTVKVADFGLSRLFPMNVTHVSTAPQGTPGYVDPEYHQCYQLTDKSDVYSFGVVLIELISSLMAVDINRERQDINLSNMAVSRIQRRALDELVDSKLDFGTNYEVRRMISSVAELAWRCLQQERDVRPSMEEVLEVLRGIESDRYGGRTAEEVEVGEDDVELSKNAPPVGINANFSD